jgi:ribosomal protein L7/L12
MRPTDWNVTDQKTRDKIKMIKLLRHVTNMLGRLGVKCMSREYPRWCCCSSLPENFIMLGLGLKESKDVVEAYLARLKR